MSNHWPSTLDRAGFDVTTSLKPIHIDPFWSNNATDNDNLSADESANGVVRSTPVVGQIR